MRAPSALSPCPKCSAESLAHLSLEERSHGRCRRLTSPESIDSVKATPKAHQSVLAVGAEHVRRESLPSILVPDVVQWAHRMLAAGVMGFELLERAVALGPHPSGETPTLRPNARQHLECVQAFWLLRRDERVECQVGEDLAQPERGQSEVAQSLERMTELMNGDEVEERLQIQAAVAVRVRREQPSIAAGRCFTELLTNCDPEVTASGGHHDDARADLTDVIVEERQTVGVSALPVRFIGNDNGDLWLASGEEVAEVGVGVCGDSGRGLGACERAVAVTHFERIAVEAPEPRSKRHLLQRTDRLVRQPAWGATVRRVVPRPPPKSIVQHRKTNATRRAGMMATVARSQDDYLWALAHGERAALAEDLSDFTAEQWRHATLCGQWDVEEVVAHLTAAASLNQWRWARSMLGARFRVDVHNQRRMVEHRGSTPAETLDRFRAIIGSSTAPSGYPPAHLGEVVVHAQDIRQPLGLPRTPDVEALTPVAAFFAPRDCTVASRSTIAGLHVRADDGSFAVGTGSLVTGSTLALVMSTAGRGAYVDQLDGPGVTTLRARVRDA